MYAMVISIVIRCVDGVLAWFRAALLEHVYLVCFLTVQNNVSETLAN